MVAFISAGVPDPVRNAALPADNHAYKERQKSEQQSEHAQQSGGIGSPLKGIVSFVVCLIDFRSGRLGDVDELSGVVQDQVGDQVEDRAAQSRGGVPAWRSSERVFATIHSLN